MSIPEHLLEVLPARIDRFFAAIAGGTILVFSAYGTKTGALFLAEELRRHGKNQELSYIFVQINVVRVRPEKLDFISPSTPGGMVLHQIDYRVLPADIPPEILETAVTHEISGRGEVSLEKKLPAVLFQGSVHMDDILKAIVHPQQRSYNVECVVVNPF